MRWNVTAEHWVLGMCEVRNGKAFFAHGKDMLLCPKNFAFFWPAHSITKSEDKDAEVGVTFHLYTTLAPVALPKHPVLFIPPNWSLPPKLEKIGDYIENGTKKLSIDGVKAPSYAAEQAKTFIDGEFQKSPDKAPKIAELAFKLRTNAAALSRDFKTATGISLLEYHELLKALRAAEAKFAGGNSAQDKIEFKSATLALSDALRTGS